LVEFQNQLIAGWSRETDAHQIRRRDTPRERDLVEIAFDKRGNLPTEFPVASER
jgi:hypothetical protein